MSGARTPIGAAMRGAYATRQELQSILDAARDQGAVVHEGGQAPFTSLEALLSRSGRPGEAGWRSSPERVIATLAEAERIGRNRTLFGCFHVLNGADGDTGAPTAPEDEEGVPLRVSTTRPIVRTGPPTPGTSTETLSGAGRAA